MLENWHFAKTGVIIVAWQLLSNSEAQINIPVPLINAYLLPSANAVSPCNKRGKRVLAILAMQSTSACMVLVILRLARNTSYLST